MFHNLPKAKDVPNSYSKEQVRVELYKLVSELDKMGDKVQKGHNQGKEHTSPRETDCN